MPIFLRFEFETTSAYSKITVIFVAKCILIGAKCKPVMNGLHVYLNRYKSETFFQSD